MTPDGEFRFFNPDNGPDFSVYSIRQLSELLRNSNPKESAKTLVLELLKKIDKGLKIISDSNRRLLSYRSDYESMTPDEQNLVLRYFAWLFIFGMYSRYLNGPPEKYPSLFTYREDTCVQDQRSLVAQQNSIDFQDNIIQPSKKMKFKDGTLYDWIINLPRIRYDWSSGYLSVGVFTGDPNVVSLGERKDLIYPILIATFGSNYCQSATADIAIQCSYVYLTKVFGYSLQDFNQLIRGYLKDERQPDFVPSQFRETGHEVAVLRDENQIEFE
jgi:hypothetical protein